jgi:replicative DNA helicase
MVEVFHKRVVAAEYAVASNPGDRIPVALLDLKRIIGDWIRGDYVLVCGGDDIDPTSVALNFILAASRHFSLTQAADRPVYFSLAKSSRRLGDRVISILADLKTQDLGTGSLSPRSFDKLVSVAAAESDTGLAFRIADAAGLDTEGLRREARRLVRETDCGMIVVDPLDMVRVEAVADRAAAQAEVARTLKEIAKETDAVVIGLASLSGLTARMSLADIRRAGYATREADIVISLHSPAHWLEREEPTRGYEESERDFDERYAKWQIGIEAVYNTCEIAVLGQVYGRTGTSRGFWEPHSGLLSNL